MICNIKRKMKNYYTAQKSWLHTVAAGTRKYPTGKVSDKLIGFSFYIKLQYFCRFDSGKPNILHNVTWVFSSTFERARISQIHQAFKFVKTTFWWMAFTFKAKCFLRYFKFFFSFSPSPFRKRIYSFRVFAIEFPILR